ncbi:hypothetical protein [Microseira sp. BLCC-F43]|uniref:hypothetical protein n=1 Tax=Microseira sp. BLCC-F43 TaxID=3153602 RepID=UPI0035B8AFC5
MPLTNSLVSLGFLAYASCPVTKRAGLLTAASRVPVLPHYGIGLWQPLLLTQFLAGSSVLKQAVAIASDTSFRLLFPSKPPGYSRANRVAVSGEGDRRAVRSPTPDQF